MWAQSAAEIGKLIATARRHHKLTQAELARSLGTTQAWISEVEQGKETAQIGKVLRVLSQLGVRLQTGVVPWSQPAAKRQPKHTDPSVSLANIITNLSGPTRGRTKR